MEEKNGNGNDTFPLDDAAIALIAELRQTITNAQVALNAILQYFAKQHGLSLPLQLADNGRELILGPPVAIRQGEQR